MSERVEDGKMGMGEGVEMILRGQELNPFRKVTIKALEMGRLASSVDADRGKKEEEKVEEFV